MIRRTLAILFATSGILLAVLLGAATAASAATALTPLAAPAPVSAVAPISAAAPVSAVAPVALPAAPAPPKPPTAPKKADSGTVTVNLPGSGAKGEKPSSSLVVLMGLTVLSVAPALLLLCTCFTKIFVVLGITRNALGLTSMPPNQVLAGLALFISMFIMSPVLTEVNDKGVQPYLKGTKTQSVAFKDGVQPLRKFMQENTRSDEIALLTKVADQPKPANPDAVPLTTLIPAFVLSELRAAFIIGFVIFVPFLVIDMVVSASLMSLGMMMLPPVTVSLPFKLLLFVMVNGWGLIITALVSSY